MLIRIWNNSIEIEVKLTCFRFPSLDDFVVSESEAREEYEKFLLKYPGSNFGVSAEHAHQKFKNFHHNLARIKYYNALEQGTATYG